MYKKHFGLRRKPFELTVHSNMLFLGETHKKALAVLKQGVRSDQGFLLFTGGVGTGKTTLINVVSNALENPAYLCLISNPTLEVEDFFYYFAAQLGLLFDGDIPKFLFLFSKLLEECKKSKRKVLLIIDEAHALPTDLLEELRPLVTMATEHKEALSVFLVGQPELLERLKEERLLPLKALIDVRFHLQPLTLEDSLQYVFFRLNRAGAGNTSFFTEEALGLVYQATGGNPRQINILCDNALLSAYSSDCIEIDGKLIRECVRDLHISGDDESFYLPPEKKIYHKSIVWIIAAIVVFQIIGGMVAYRLGWVDFVWNYLSQKI